MLRIIIQIFAVISLLTLHGCSTMQQSIIASISTPSSVKLLKSPTIIKLEGVSQYTKYSDMESFKVVKALINGKGPYNIGVMLEDGKVDPEFITGLLMSNTMQKLGESLRPGKIHHAIKTFQIGDLILEDFAMEVYSPSPSEMNSPLPYLDGVLTSGMLKNLKVSFNSDFTEMIIYRNENK